MATYNGASYVCEQIASILPQLTGESELVIVDDASRDETIAMVESLDDPRIRIISQPHNLGVVRTFERAIREASGDIIFLSDQDDVWHSDKIARMMKAFAADPKTTLVLSNGELIDADRRPLPGRLYKEGMFWSGVLANLVKNRYQGSTMAFRREILEAALPFPDGIPMHDSWIGLVNAVVGRTVYLPESLLFYRRHESNVTTGKRGTILRMASQRWRLGASLLFRLRTMFRVKQNLRLRQRANFYAGIPDNRQETCRSQRAVVFAPFFSSDAPASRPRFVGSVMARTMPVDVVTSDFDHGQKKKRDQLSCPPFERIVYLETRPYYSNVGFARLLSHLQFSFIAAAYFRKNRDKYDVVYSTLPLNVMTWLVFWLAQEKTKIVDVVDIWPDVLPFPSMARKALAPMFAVWKWFFKSAVNKADIVMAVSDEFIDEAGKHANGMASVKRFYIGHDKLTGATEKQPIFTIAYVGNLGRLYDFETLLDVLAEDELRDCVQLFIIGAGDRQDWLLGELETRGLRHRFFGAVYERKQLAEILRACHAGFNGYINTTAAFSYKASTYLAAGLPLINSMTGDLMRIVAEHGLGVNYEGGNRKQLKECILRMVRNGTTEMAASSERFFSSELESAKICADIGAFLGTNMNLVDDSVLACVGGGKRQ
jgi:glycosyltransferase involved in cell wall biosynthesis